MSTPEDPLNVPPERDPDPTTAVDPLDERLSASLDGHEPAPGSDLDARALARTRDLAAARDLLAVPPPPLDDIARRRLVRTALDASSTSSRRAGGRGAARGTRIGAVAAAVLAVVALSGWGLASLNHGSSKNADTSRGATAAAPAPAGPVNLHEVSNPDVLRRRVEAALGAAGPTPAPTSTAARNPIETTVPGGTESLSSCISAARVPTGDTPELLGTATFHGARALVVVAREPSRTLIFVLATADCRLLSFQFLKQ